MKVSELSGALLDYWVVTADGSRGPEYVFEDDKWWAKDCGVRVYYSRTWTQGGPIIEREGIAVRPLAQLETFRPGDHCWMAHYLHGMHKAYGRTLLEAAMRSFVKAKFGETVADLVLT